MSLSKHIPNAITCCNLLSGCISIMFITYYKNPVMAAVMIFAAAVFDFLDGFAARALHAKSPIGADLDSLSDVVSFGVAPSFIIAWYLKASGLHCNMTHFDIIPCLAFFIAVFAAIRLAKFNNDTRQASSFIGLPVPATGLFIASLPLMMSATGPSKPSKCPTIIICPVEETGKNSVRPSSIPTITAIRYCSIITSFPAKLIVLLYAFLHEYTTQSS